MMDPPCDDVTASHLKPMSQGRHDAESLEHNLPRVVAFVCPDTVLARRVGLH